MSGPRILVTGSRAWLDHDAAQLDLIDAVDALWEQRCGEPCELVVGDCATGVDRIAADIWRRWHDVHPDWYALPEVHRADWKTHGKAAGPLRNVAMVASGADLALAFPLGRSAGTWDCVRRARAAGIEVRLHEAVRTS